MVSEYLNRRVRDRLTIAHDLALRSNSDWTTSSAIADGLDVMFAVSGYEPDSREPTFLHVSSFSWTLTGYWPIELVGQPLDILYGPNTSIPDIRRFEGDILSSGKQKFALPLVIKMGLSLAATYSQPRSIAEIRTACRRSPAFITACPIGECVSAAPLAN